MNRKDKRRHAADLFARDRAESILFTNLNEEIIQVNKEFTALFGWTEEELIGKKLKNLCFIPDVRAEEKESYEQRRLRGEKIPFFPTKRKHKNGDTLAVFQMIAPIRSEQQDLIAFAFIFHQAPEQLQTKKRWEESEQRYQSLFEHNPHAVFTFDLEGRFTSCNKAVERLAGCSLQELTGAPFLPLLVPEDRERVASFFQRVTEGEAQEYETAIVNRCKQLKILHVVNTPIVVEGKIIGVYGIATNITDRKKDEEKLARLAFYDQTTGVANRHLFSRDIKRAVQTAEKEETRFALLHINVDRFKYVNEVLGMEAGDRVLKSIATRIKPSIPANGSLYRLHGDDFYVLLHSIAGREEAEAVAEKIGCAFQKPWKVNSHELVVTASMGVALYPEDGKTEDLLIKRSGQALSCVKAGGQHGYQFFNEKIGRDADTTIELETDLKHAIERGELQLFYQPKIDLHTGRVIGTEALLRWQHPDKGMIGPDQFIPLAEQNGYIYDLTAWVLYEACRQSGEWTRRGMPDSISVNISPHHLYRQDLVSTILHAIAETGLPPHKLEIEITENGFMQNMEEAIETIKQLKQIGIRVSIDDFGTGFSSFSHLKVLPVDVLKIDRSFIKDLSMNRKDRMIVRSIIQLAHAMELTVVAEGVEEKEHLHILKQLGCQVAQGYYMSRPLPAGQYASWLEQFLFSFE